MRVRERGCCRRLWRARLPRWLTLEALLPLLLPRCASYLLSVLLRVRIGMDIVLWTRSCARLLRTFALWFLWLREELSDGFPALWMQ